ncbi:hypothetical protein ACFSFX_17385, partial [Arthrobacter flavus]
MKSSKASSTGPEIPPGYGADSASDNGTANTSTGASAGASSGYGPAGPMGVESVWTAPVVEPPAPTTDTDPAEADLNDADSPKSDSTGSDSTEPERESTESESSESDPTGSDSAWLFSEAWASYYFGDDPDVRVRSSSEPPALSGQLRMAAVGGLD